jgi:CheY-like chemotaxis protein
MKKQELPITMLVADDDPDDCMLIADALEEAGLIHNLYFVGDGEELMDYLYRQGKYAELTNSPRPDLILLDLNMPKKDGREALREIKTDPDLRRVPVVVLTTSQADEDIQRTYDLGANSFIVKPVTFESLVEVMTVLVKYWYEVVELPPERIGN